MAKNKPRTVLYRRRRQQKTNYSKRLKLLLSGKPRLVFRLTNKQIIAQVVNFAPQGDKVITAVSSNSLKKFGWDYSGKNFPAAYLTGLLLGKEAMKHGQKEAIFDTGFHAVLKKGKVCAFLKGVLDAGLTVPNSGDDILPSEEKIQGKDTQKFKQVKEKLTAQ